jgi:hypothetical protein
LRIFCLFWPANIAAWFASVEGVFELRGIVEQRARYFNVLAALPEATVVLIADLIESSPLPDDPFDRLKARLVTAHQLTDMQKVEKLLSFPAMGQQKPSELLAEMLRFCPRGEENSVFFNCLFLQKLPRELRVLLSEADMADKRLLSERADQIWAHNSHIHHDAIAAVSSETDGDGDGAVAAVGAVFPGIGEVGDRPATGSLGAEAPRRRRPRRGSWLGSPSGCARPTGGMATTRSTVPTPPTASGRETELSGAARRRRRRVTGTHSGREFWHAVFGGHRCQF